VVDAEPIPQVDDCGHDHNGTRLVVLEIQTKVTPASIHASPPRIVLFASPEWAGRFMAVQLSRSDVNLAAAVIGADPLEQVRFSFSRLRRVAATLGMRAAIQAFLGATYGLTHLMNRVVARDLAPQIEDLAKQVPVHRVVDYISDETLQLLRSLAPEILVICGTPILPRSLLSIATDCVLNVHTSVLPHYRGGGSLFWALFFNDYEKIGFTIHEAVASVDAGPYLYQERLPVKAHDNPESLTQRAFVKALPVLKEILTNSDLPIKETCRNYERPVPFAWRAPTKAVKNMVSGPTLRDRAVTTIQRFARRTGWSPYRASSERALGVFFWHRNLHDGTPKTNWRRILGHTTIKELRARIQLIRKYFTILPMTEALEYLQSSNPDKKAKVAVLTVDDGYRDFRTNLLPLLNELETPCTLFACSGAVQTGVWYQHVYDLIEGLDGDRLSIPWADLRVPFGDVRHRVITTEHVLNAHLKRMSATRRTQCTSDLIAMNGPVKGSDTDRFCSVDDLSFLKQSRLVEIHPHSQKHHPFETLSDKELQSDLNECRTFFHDELQTDSALISYPNGNIRAHQEQVLTRCRFRFGFTTEIGLNSVDTNLFRIKRIGVTNSQIAALEWTIRKHLART
jgi:peptidoglycan/xylan/chitin deacetylase (PgdA/CDA1 family)